VANVLKGGRTQCIYSIAFKIFKITPDSKAEIHVPLLNQSGYLSVKKRVVPAT
jgi:hypothetical protein